MLNYLRFSFGYIFMRCVYVKHVNFAWKNICRYVYLYMYVICCMCNENENPYYYI